VLHGTSGYYRWVAITACADTPQIDDGLCRQCKAAKFEKLFAALRKISNETIHTTHEG
jgi:hypothetical protein